MTAFTEVEIDGAIFNLNLDSQMGNIRRVAFTGTQSLEECRAMFYDAWRTGGCPDATKNDVAKVIRADTMDAVCAAIRHASKETIDAMLERQRYVM